MPTVKQKITAEIPETLLYADELLKQYGRWARDRQRVNQCGSAEGRYKSPQDDEDRVPKEVLQHIDEVLMCQRALSRVPEQERHVLNILYIPKRMPVEMQLRISRITPRICRERHLAGLRMFNNLIKVYEKKP